MDIEKLKIFLFGLFSTGISLRLSPKYFTSPEILYPFFPDSTFAKVLLPDPFGPIIAWTSPGLILRLSPFKFLYC